MTETVGFKGAQFHVADKVGMLPLMRFAKVAQAGTDANSMDGLAAMFDLLEQCIHPDDWARFQSHADKVRADGDELMAFVSEVMAVVGSRPTRRSSGSSGGPRTIEPSSADDSSSPVIHRLNEQGRPDLAWTVRKRQESLSA